MARSRNATTEAEAPQARSEPKRGKRARPEWGLVGLDALIVAAFLGLTFLLGIFPLKDTDFWWHLRTGDLIRQNGEVPRIDPYLYGGPPEKPWIDLHWGFEVLLSWGFAYGGVVFLTLAKCVITTVAVALLLTARRREWPFWTMALAWLPALLVLAGRMYVRPETLTLLCMAGFLAVLFRWKERPKLAFLLPVVQVAWVNVQGLFVFGPVLLAVALLDAMLEPGAFAKSRKPWWRTVLIATALTGFACLLNPYGLRGALFPIQLLGTMGNPIFENIGELQPLPKFIRSVGWGNPSLQLHLFTMIVGALSFLLPMAWRVRIRFDRSEPEGESRGRSEPKKKGQTRKAEKAPKPRAAEPWRLSPFRLLLFAAFSLLSWKATRNSHQFATIIGTLSAWNFAEWASAIQKRRRERGEKPTMGAGVRPRLAVLAGIILLFGAVASGAFYDLLGEGRTVGLGEEPLWYPHGAVRAAGRPGMPDRFVCFHNGHAALFEYEHGPEKKVYADARLEVVGPQLYEEYRDLQTMLAKDREGWKARLREQGHPGILADLVQSGSEEISATLLADPDWSCVWFDAVAADFVHRSSPSASGRIDFTQRHFEPEPETDPHGVEELAATAKALRSVAVILQSRSRPDLARPLLLLGYGYGQRALTSAPDSAEAWKQLGMIEMLRITIGPEAMAARVRQPFDPIFDLSLLRASYALGRAEELRPGDFLTLYTLENLYESRGMLETARPMLHRIEGMKSINATQRAVQQQAGARIAMMDARLGPVPKTDWKNLEELERAFGMLVERGRVASAAALLEQAYPARGRSWEVADRLATLRLHLGQPAKARAIWEGVAHVPRPGLRMARVAATYLIEENPEAARRHYRQAIEAEPTQFEALYGLAVLEADAGRREPARMAANAAIAQAPSDVARIEARKVLAATGPGASEEVSR